MKILLPFILLLLTNNALADIKITNAKARSSIGNLKSSAVYMDIDNTGNDNDLLILATGDIANIVELHKTVNTGDIHKMVKIDKLAIPANSTIKLKPHGLHIMLMDLKKNLEAGEEIPIMLHFEKAGIITINAKVINNK